jgi:hypothetical protein
MIRKRASKIDNKKISQTRIAALMNHHCTLNQGPSRVQTLRFTHTLKSKTMSIKFNKSSSNSKPRTQWGCRVRVVSKI